MSQTSQNEKPATTQKKTPFWRNKGKKNEEEKSGDSATSSKPRIEKKQFPDLKPKHLSTTASKEHNDPLSKDEFLAIDGLAGFQEIRQSRKFYLDFSGFMLIVRKSYDAQIRFDRSLQKYVSFSMWQYYCVLLLWKRIHLIIASRGINVEELALIENVISEELAVPDDVNSYLNGIGDVVDQSGRMNQFDIQVRPRNNVHDLVCGFYNRVAANTHVFYETLPSPGVALYRVQRDFIYTVTARGAQPAEQDWNLPNQVAPQVNNGGRARPTANLLGWGAAQLLTQNQRDTLINAGFMAEDGAVVSNGSRVVASLPINQELVNAVSQYIKSSKIKCFGKMSNSRFGSMAQIPFTTRVAGDVVPERYVQIATKDGVTQSSSGFSAPIARASAIYRYRVDRIAEGADDWSCYEFQGAANAEGDRQPQEIPAAWLATANSVFTHGVGGQSWNAAEFNIGQMNGLDIANQATELVRTRALRK